MSYVSKTNWKDYNPSNPNDPTAIPKAADLNRIEKGVDDAHKGDVNNNSIKSEKLRITEDENRIKLDNLSDEVLQAMTGETSINVTPAINSVTTEKIAPEAVTDDKINSELMLLISSSLPGTIAKPLFEDGVFVGVEYTSIPKNISTGLDSGNYTSDDGFNPDRAFDEDSGTNYFREGSYPSDFPITLTVDLDEVKEYKLTNFQALGTDSSSTPRNFKLYGSDDGLGWEELVEGEILRNGEYQDFPINKTSSLQYLKFEVLSNHNNQTTLNIRDLRVYVNELIREDEIFYTESEVIEVRTNVKTSASVTITTNLNTFETEVV